MGVGYDLQSHVASRSAMITVSIMCIAILRHQSLMGEVCGS